MQVLVVIGRRHGQVVGHTEVAKPVAVVTATHRHRRTDLPLDFTRHIPVELAAAAMQHFVRPARRRLQAPEVLVRQWTALAVQTAVQQVTVRDVVPVGVGPRAVDLVDRCRDRVVRLWDGERVLRDIAAERHFDRGLAVAEQVVRAAETRAPVLPVRHIRHCGEGTVLDEPRGRNVLLGNVRVEVIEPHAVVQRQAPNRPLILRVDAHVGLDTLVIVVRRRVSVMLTVVGRLLGVGVLKV